MFVGSANAEDLMYVSTANKNSYPLVGYIHITSAHVFHVFKELQCSVINIQLLFLIIRMEWNFLELLASVITSSVTETQTQT